MAGVGNLFRVNMGLKKGECALVVTDLPTPDHWQQYDSDRLASMVRRNVLARMISEIGRHEFRESVVDFHAFPATGRSGTEPPSTTAQTMAGYDVVVAITNFSLSHTDAREQVCRRGGRVASMPGFNPEMFYSGGPMAVDYIQVAENTQQLAGLLTSARTAKITSPAGTDITVGIEGRSGMSDDGNYESPGRWGNLPAGEAYIAPVEGTADGRLVLEPGWFRQLTRQIAFSIEKGLITGVEGEGPVAESFRQLFAFDSTDPQVVARRNVGELGIGTNPNARSVESGLECEKIIGTVHFGIGDNAHMGGLVVSDSHVDLIINKPSLLLDGVAVIRTGTWIF
jgi:leucyl aminopeptidase (aminopeptidase T)